jgi:chaperonin GroES
LQGEKISEVGVMKIRPLYDRVLVRRIEEEAVTKSGIVIPDTAKEKPIQGEILAVGKGKVLQNGKVRPITLKQGDRVLFEKWAGSEFKVEGEERLILREDEILGIVEP